MDILNCNWDVSRFLIFSGNVYDDLIYYSHLVPLILSLLIGFFVFLNDKKSLANRLLFFLVLSFSSWVFFDLVLWANEKIEHIMFFWSILVPVELMIYFFSFYLSYVFIKKEDLPYIIKMLFGFLFIPVILFVFTRLNLTAFDYTNCDRGAFEGVLWEYIYYVEFFIIALMALFFVKNIREIKDNIRKKQGILFFIGILFLLITFSLGNFVLIYELDWKYEQYKLFGMPIFVGFLAYLIVKHNAFNIKLLGAQALVATLVILVGSQYFFVQNTTSKILVGVTLALSLGFGYILVKSVEKEVKQKEELEVANKEITERKEQLQKMADSLAIANDKLKQLDQAKTDFINIASHQLKHAPTPIKGYLSLLLDGTYGEISENQKGVLEKLNDANNRQIHLVDDLLAVARMESGKVQLDFQKENIEDICQGVYNNLAVTAKEKNLEFKYEKSEQHLPALMLDKSKMFEAIFNFVDNAVKYTPSGSVILKTELAQTSNYKPRKDRDDQKPEIAGPVVRVTVSDTGTGISDENISHLFAKFSRKDVAKANSDGTGLGLYVVKLMIEAHGGRTWAQSEGEGKGSQFIIEIPVEGK